MKKNYLVIGTVTHASMGRDLLRKSGFNASVHHTPSMTELNGCSYSIVVVGDVDRAVRILRSGGIKVLAVHPEQQK